jgi:6-phosphogluconate dehydrogenase
MDLPPRTEITMNVGMIGLGKMGANMAERLIEASHHVVGFDFDPGALARLDEAGGRGAESLAELVQSLGDPPRVVWMMVPAGDAVEKTLDSLVPLLGTGDVVVDGGNSNYKDSQRRGERLAAAHIHYVDVGTSGGIWGRTEGYSMMVGGDAEAVQTVRPLLEALAPGRDRGWGHVGPSGAGHFVKMVHNGIEYGLMQAYAEGFAVLRKKEEYSLDLAQVAEIWRYGSVVRSWLLDLTARALKDDADLEGIAPWVSDSGEGRWTVNEAIDLDVPVPVITVALMERFTSRDPDSFAYKLLAAMRNQFGGHVVKHEDA